MISSFSVSGSIPENVMPAMTIATKQPTAYPTERIDIAVALSVSLNHMLVTIIIEFRKIELTLAAITVPTITGQNSFVEITRNRIIAPKNETN